MSILLLFIVYCLVILLDWQIGKHISNQVLRSLMALGFFTGMVITPIWDEVIFGKYLFNYLCEYYSGLKVYSQIAIHPDNYDQKGRIDSNTWVRGNDFNLPEDLKDADYWIDGKAYCTETNFTDWEILSIWRYERTLIECRSGKLLTRYVQFIYEGGWVARNVVGFQSMHYKSCPNKAVGHVHAAFYPDPNLRSTGND